jgi:predicted TIM-barrel fold metal-dependent hydrolase
MTTRFGEPEKFPFFAGRVYTPEMALPKEMAALHQSLHIERVVIVTPSVYGTDNAATLAGMKARGAEARGVAVIDDKTPESELDAMHGAGVRGIRINLATGGVSDPALARSRLETAIDRVKGRNWHVQIYADLKVIAALKEQFAASPVPLVFDHFAGAQAALGLGQPGFADVLDLVRSGRAYVKISGAYRASKAAPDYSDVVPLAKALIAANPDRIVWGTDWPHPNSVTPPGKKRPMLCHFSRSTTASCSTCCRSGRQMRLSEKRFWSQIRRGFTDSPSVDERALFGWLIGFACCPYPHPSGTSGWANGAPLSQGWRLRPDSTGTQKIPLLDTPRTGAERSGC